MYVGDWRDGSADEHALQIHRSNGAVRSYIGGWLYREVSVPEPSRLGLLGAGLLGLGLAKRRKTTAGDIDIDQ
jgi:hypothetical protein